MAYAFGSEKSTRPNVHLLYNIQKSKVDADTGDLCHWFLFCIRNGVNLAQFLIWGPKLMYENNLEERDTVMNMNLYKLLKCDEEDDYCDVTITFALVEGGEMIKYTPVVRIIFIN